jgi:hypothetical protein
MMRGFPVGKNLSKITAISLLLMSIARIAQGDCSGIVAGNNGESYQLGTLAIGSPRQKILATGVRLIDCKTVAGSGCHGEDEAFGNGPDGLRYYLRRGYLFRVSLDDISRYPAPLIGEIQAGEGVGDVRIKINRLGPQFPPWDYISFHGAMGPIFSTGLCWQGVGKKLWGIALFHDMNGRLIRIEEAADLSSVVRTGQDCPGDVIDDVDDRGSLGEVLYGASRSSFPASLKPLRNCSNEPSRECPGLNDPNDESYQTFIDQYGVHYWVNDIEIVRKELLDVMRYPRPLIAGIKAGDSHSEVEKKLHGLGNSFPDFHYSPFTDDQKYSGLILSDICIRSSNDAVWSYEFDFDNKDRLIEIKQAAGPLPEE